MFPVVGSIGSDSSGWLGSYATCNRDCFKKTARERHCQSSERALENLVEIYGTQSERVVESLADIDPASPRLYVTFNCGVALPTAVVQRPWQSPETPDPGPGAGLEEHPIKQWALKSDIPKPR